MVYIRELLDFSDYQETRYIYARHRGSHREILARQPHQLRAESRQHHVQSGQFTGERVLPVPQGHGGRHLQ